MQSSTFSSLLRILFFLAIVAVDSNAQTSAQISRELEKRGITSFEQIQSELKKRGMTEADARRQARLYGIDYDSYVANYLLKVSNANGEDTLKPIEQIGTDTINFNAFSSKGDTLPATPVSKDTLSSLQEEDYFGYDIFTNNPAANQFAMVGNIDPGYIIGPGDEIRLYLWGESELQFEGKVDINGNLFVPDIGQIFVSGVSYDQLNTRLKQYLSRFYSGLTSDPPNIFLDVSLSKLRPIRIVMMGESNNPGSHLMTSFATVVNSLYASGGVKTSGSLREIKVFRNNKPLATIDFYDYLTTGKVSDDVRLVSNDVVFIKTRMSSIKLFGEVNQAGIFELKPGEGIRDLVRFAGGLKPTAYTGTVRVKRLKSISQRNGNNVYDREIITIDYNQLIKEDQDFKLQDGDEITFAKVLDEFENQVVITGSVFRPGDYELTVDMTVKQLLEKAGGVKPDTYLHKLDLFRKDRNGDLKFRSVSLANAINDSGSLDNLTLQANDSIRVYNEKELKTLEMVSIDGFVRTPRQMVWRENLTLYDLVFMSVNIEDLEYQNRILTSRADLFRFKEGDLEYSVIPFTLEDLLDGKFNMDLKPKDKVVLYSKDITKELENYIVVKGAIKSEGRYQLLDSMTIEDAILRAGGFVKWSYRDSVTVTSERIDFTGNQIAMVNKQAIDIDYLLGNKPRPTTNNWLKSNDVIKIDYIPGSADQRIVIINGEIKFPGEYALTSKKETLSQVISRAGNISPNAYLPGAKFYRNGQQLAFAFDKLLSNGNEQFDIILNDQDSIYIPEAVYTVRVEGEVNNPSLQKFVSNQSVRAYVKNAGGKTQRGRRIFITKPNGFTQKVGFLRNPKVLDGSVVTVIPKKKKDKSANQGKFLEGFGTIAAIVSSTITTIFLVQQLN